MEEKEIVQKSLEERFNEQNKNKQSKAPYTLFSVIGFIGAIVSISMGFYKLCIYENNDSFRSSSKNVYVGGDAYNYIINGTYATSYFVLAVVCMVFACSMLILKSINQNK
ncbi:hypothetical protein LAV73_12370 [Lysinibacillus xylanilyticus]|uniref:hypothetical protein n=1 Tax=Lysinibacillus TaxID=400634 RepID=UPI002B256520|nr:hypothetical protein [Lysinibacillus xylanilyticus]MEB2280790.1 hypothetical protein [Lysinibacillus xylanilyticus]